MAVRMVSSVARLWPVSVARTVSPGRVNGTKTVWASGSLAAPSPPAAM
jgi:hypothetical protein